MSELKDLLLNTLKGVSASFDQALADLQEVTQQADQAAKAADPLVTVRLTQLDRDPDGVLYGLHVLKGSEGQGAGYYRLNPAGYPIEHSSSRRAFTAGGDRLIRIPNREQLLNHFRDVMKNQNSPLVTAIAYILNI